MEYSRVKLSAIGVSIISDGYWVDGSKIEEMGVGNYSHNKYSDIKLSDTLYNKGATKHGSPFE